MDDTTLTGLEAMLAAAPGNAALGSVVAAARLERGQADLALAALEGTGESAGIDILRARALLVLGRPGEAKAAYDRAVAGSSGSEDLALAGEIDGALSRATASEGESPSPQGGRLRLIAGGAEKSDDGGRFAVAPAQERVTFADVGGLDDVKEQIRKRIILPFLKPSLFERFKRKAGGGILLYGPPGCGKTLLARATAGECDARFFNVAISDILDMYIGESETRLHALFEKARAAHPSVLFFDEIEALGGKRGGRHESSTMRLVSQFLSEMDGFANANAGVLVLGATNLPWLVDPAFRRPGRFDRFVFAPPPDRAAREAILAIHLSGRPVDPRVSAAALANRTSGFSGADLAGLVDSAADAAIEATIAAGHDVPLAPAHFDGALSEVKPTTLEWLTTARNHARYANEGGQYDDVLEFLKRHGKD